MQWLFVIQNNEYWENQEAINIGGIGKGKGGHRLLLPTFSF